MENTETPKRKGNPNRVKWMKSPRATSENEVAETIQEDTTVVREQAELEPMTDRNKKVLVKLFRFIYDFARNWQTMWFYEWGRVVYKKHALSLYKWETFELFKFWDKTVIIGWEEPEDYEFICNFLLTELSL